MEEIQASGIEGNISTIQLDVTSDDSISAAVDTVRKEFGRVDVFVSNAGISGYEATGSEKMRKLFETNVIGAVTSSNAFVDLLLKSSRPYIIQVSSGLGSIGLATDPEYAWYNVPSNEYRMSKAALNMATIQQHKHLHSQGIRVFAYCPGFVRSNLRGESEKARSGDGLAGDPSDSAKGILDICEGKRDADVGRFINATGIYPW